jgi:hypothetical protein
MLDIRGVATESEARLRLHIGPTSLLARYWFSVHPELVEGLLKSRDRFDRLNANGGNGKSVNW